MQATRRIPKKQKTVTMAFRFRPEIAEFIRKKAHNEHMGQNKLLEGLVEVAGKTFHKSHARLELPRV